MFLAIEKSHKSFHFFNFEKISWLNFARKKRLKRGEELSRVSTSISIDSCID
jgi:hypothetical protein